MLRHRVSDFFRRGYCARLGTLLFALSLRLFIINLPGTSSDAAGLFLFVAFKRGGRLSGFAADVGAQRITIDEPLTLHSRRFQLAGFY